MTLSNKIRYTDYISSAHPIIVQVGSHDGVLGEEYGLQEFLNSNSNFDLYLIEPIKKYFDNLINVYSSYENKIHYLNFAITDVDGISNMVEQGCMSFIAPHGSIAVTSKTWQTFTKEYDIHEIDLLLLDCEGYEYNILKQINYIKCMPKVIRYEYFHIPNKQECDNFLLGLGYKIEYCYYDSTYNKVAYL